jgi:molybdate transport system substrate-binding protein
VHIAVAKPEVAPYGERAIQALKYYGLFDKVRDKIVYAENIAQAAQYVSTGNAEVGFLALALVKGSDLRDKGYCLILDARSYTPVEQAGVLVKNQEPNPEASAFLDFVLGESCKPLFEKHGYMIP